MNKFIDIQGEDMSHYIDEDILILDYQFENIKVNCESNEAFSLNKSFKLN